MTAATLSAEDRPVVKAGLRVRFLRNEAVILLSDREEACVLNPQATAILQLCDGTRTVQDLITELQSRYLGNRDAMAQDIHACLSKLRDLQILQ